jgi:hypothetical protein
MREAKDVRVEINDVLVGHDGKRKAVDIAFICKDGRTHIYRLDPKDAARLSIDLFHQQREHKLPPGERRQVQRRQFDRRKSA